MENGSNEGKTHMDEKKTVKTKVHLDACVAEKHNLSFTAFPIAARLLSEEIQRTQETGKATFDHRYVDLCHGKPTKIVTKVLIPQQDAPSFNYVGKVLGPKGSTLKALSEASKCRILVLGKGSMRDKAKEDEYRKSLDPKYAHLSEELHVEVSCVAPAEEAHERVAYALKELRLLLVPDPPGMGGPMDAYQYAPMAPPMGVPPAVMRGGGRMPPGLPAGSSSAGSAKVMSLLEKARNAMEYGPPRGRFPPPSAGMGRGSRFPPPMQPDFDSEEGQWTPQFKAPTPSRFYPPRTAPYGRP